MSEDDWTPRRELALPNELLHKILLLVITESVHTICLSTEDTSWEKNIMDTLYQVSPSFRAISSELAAKVFDIPKSIREDDDNLLHDLRRIFNYLGHIGERLRDPADFGGVSFQTIDCKASSFVFGYALYLSCISLRRNSTRSPRDVFESTHKVILSALAQSEALCDRVYPVEVTSLLRQSIHREFELAQHGRVLVRSFHELDEYTNSMLVLQPSEKEDGSGPVTAVRSLIHGSLNKIEAVFSRYTAALPDASSPMDPRIHELPGTLVALRKASALRFGEDDEFNLEQRLRDLVRLSSVGCPFFNKDARVRTMEQHL
ncbi:hypothetical protein M413DRAFT_445197 [Hebeloma cylindrosporum]|uniref:Uncharacterized protein n=1 Tax=Hebeloma cylindrosporum TaxID=76867 RepID=A0A0C2XWF9_HEBCY|nr:hypothetical protein M413DRAFT_445197 [Hebeloma cylindrosporum h7]